MAMSKDKKANFLAEFEATVAEAKGIVFVKYQGTKVKDLETLRSKLHDQQVSARVAKNRILKIALERKNLTIDEALLDHPILLVASRTDEVMPAQLVKGFGKEVETIELAGGLVDGRFLNASEMKLLADLPSRDQLRAQVVGVLAAPLSGLIRTLKAPLTGLVSVLRQYQTSQ